MANGEASSGWFWKSFRPADVITIAMLLVVGVSFGVRVEGRISEGERNVARIEIENKAAHLKMTAELEAQYRILIDQAMERGRLIERVDAIQREMARR